MKSFFLIADLSEDGPVWLNVLWPYVNVARETVNATPLYVPVDPNGNSRLSRQLKYLYIKRKKSPELRQKVLEEIDRDGPNILFIKAFSRKNVDWATVFSPIWDVFSHRVLLIGDPLAPAQLSRDVVSQFDLVTCFCGDRALEYEQAFGVRSLHIPAHTDVLRFHCAEDFRPIDLLLVGRRNSELHAPIHKYFNAPERKTIFVDFVTRTQTRMPLREEFGLLMSTYGKSKAAFCYEPSYVARFDGTSPLTARWVHAWAAGCTIFGSKPHGRGVAEAMDWPESIIELSPDPDQSIRVVEETLADEEGMRRRRRRNVLEAVRRHDSRYRLRDILQTLGVPLPPELEQGLAQLKELENRLSREA